MIKKKKETKINLGTLYDFNKDLVQKEKDLTEEEIKQKKIEIIEFIIESHNEYYMLLCRERYDYTILTFKNGKNSNMTNVLVDECLKNRGVIKSIHLTENKDAVEIWLSIGKESYCYYFFPYDAAIVEV